MVTLAAASWGTWSLFLRPTGLPATVTTPIVFAVMGLVALPFALRKPAPRWDRTTVALLLANAAFDALNVAAFFTAMEYTEVAIAVLTHYVAPILIAVAAPRIDGTSARGVAPATAVALAGLVVVLQPWNVPADGALIGAAFGLTSAFCYAGNVFVVGRLAVRIGSARQMSYHALIAAALLSPLAFGRIHEVTSGDLALLVAGGATIGTASGIVFVIGLLRVGSARTAVLTFAEPLVAVLIGAFVWGEPLHPLSILGGAMVLGAGIHVASKAR
ncbi:MAG: hypothetical protein H6Q90_4164 [Deltaproteobacteria bacterium]|nr:hypothetical protein [Deltaproteobacteria bacterium]